MAKVRRKRYTAAQKQEIIDFVKDHNKSKGRGGQAAAAEKYKVSPLSISNWLKAAGVSTKKASKKKVAKKATRSTESSSVTGSVASVLKRMTVIQERIAELSADYEILKKQL